jgi:hypothetical protein
VSNQKIKIDGNRNSNQRNGSLTDKSMHLNGSGATQHQNGYSQQEYEYQQCDYQQTLSKNYLNNYNAGKGPLNH